MSLSRKGNGKTFQNKIFIKSAGYCKKISAMPGDQTLVIFHSTAGVEQSVDELTNTIKSIP